ncbi:glycoside hydrolase family 3 protein [Alteromonas oceanisediminis]|uniref:glycoside hydrolase family 3 protein n=1 Tax=Alteromonas oceanisediminis TaxID=2836180 RepID=UPI001BDB641E|nr:exo 1,3/1,4-beta-D-glucan glucohydrolase [Alteromonas oceanisediminis]MBT0587409.1 glycoside hydrolase family 3 protein [Alteromonas oceanisediminis]
MNTHLSASIMISLLLSICALLLGCAPTPSESDTTVLARAADAAKVQRDLDIWPTLNIEVASDPKVEARVAQMLAEMTLEQKVAQMIQPEIRDITPEDMRRYGFGSYLNGGGAFPNNNKHSTPADWIALAEAMYQASVDSSLDGSSIPTMWGTDAVHGHNNVIGATLFPHNIGLGAANNPELIEKIAHITATEVMVTGIDWVFAPTVATVRDDRWGRTYESYSEDPAIVKSYSAAIVRGLQGPAGEGFLGDDRVISTVKHFIGDGGTVKGDDQGNNVASEQTLFDVHAQGYVGGLSAGAQSVMASFNSWHGEKVHGHSYLLTDVLKEKMGFDGFVVGDWNGHGQIKGCSNDNCAQAAIAGLDIFMVPTDAWKPLYQNIIAQVKSGVIPMARIDDAVTRILRVKVRAGLFEKPSPALRQFSGKTQLIGQPAHRDVARQAVRESLVLLKNDNGLLPLSRTQKILVAGDAAHNIGKQSGGWTITWQGTNNSNEDFPGGTSIYQGIVNAAGTDNIELAPTGDYTDKPDVAIVVYGEEPYAEGHGDKEHLEYQRGNKTDLALLRKLRAQGIPIVSVFISGRPLWVNPELNASDAFVAAWLPGSEGQGVADVLFVDSQGLPRHDFVGKLSFSWPASPYQATVNVGDEDYHPLFPYGYGLNYTDTTVLGNSLPVTFDVPATQNQDRVVYSGKAEKPWQLNLIDAGQRINVVASTMKTDSVSFRTTDRIVQEDAFILTAQGGETAGVSFDSINFFREDLSSVSQESTLQFMVQVKQISSAAVNLGMSCEAEGDASDSCSHVVNISPTLNALAGGDWHKVQLELACMTNNGVKLSELTSVFQIQSAAPFSLAISDIRIAPETEAVRLSCD